MDKVAKIYRVLIIDDNDEMVRIVKIELEINFKCYVDVATDYLHGFELLKIWPYDVVLIDLKMSGISGANLLRLTRNVKTKTKFYVFSHLDMQDIKEEIIGIEDLFSGIIDKNNMDEEFKKIFGEENEDND